jgi:hypothetical protein
MTPDRILTERAATAMGFKIVGWPNDSTPFVSRFPGDFSDTWSPLVSGDDAQQLQAAKRVWIAFDDGTQRVRARIPGSPSVFEPYGDDIGRAVRRAIVRAVAEDYT